MTKAIFTAGNLFIDYGRDAVPPETEQTVTASQVDPFARPGFGYWDPVQMMLRSGYPVDPELVPLREMHGLLDQFLTWNGDLVRIGADIAASGIRFIDAARQAVRRSWTDQIILADGSTPNMPLATKGLLYANVRQGALDITSAQEYAAVADTQKDNPGPTMAQIWGDMMGQRVNLIDSVSFGPLVADWKAYDTSWAVSRTHAA